MKKNAYLFQSRLKPNLRSKMVGPEDLMNGRIRPVSFDSITKYNITPYCIDFERNLIIGALGIDPYKASQATFHYDYIRSNAKNFLLLPINSLQINPPKINLSATLLFSPGRCGSTLLSKVISKMGIVSISEPDIYSQVALYIAPRDKASNKTNQVRFMLKWANYFLLSPFLKIGASKLLIKFRSHVNASPAIVLSSFSGPYKTIFLRRNFESWCISRMRVFANPVEENLSIYIQSLYCLKFLLKNTDCLVLDYEDLNQNPRNVIDRLSTFFGIQVNFEDLMDVFEKDSQADTRLARDQAKKSLTTFEIETIKKIWHERAPSELLDQINQIIIAT